MQVDAHVPRVLHHRVRHVDVVNSTVITKFSLLIGKINLQRAFIIAINLSFSVNLSIVCVYFCRNFAAEVDCLKMNVPWRERKSGYLLCSDC